MINGNYIQGAPRSPPGQISNSEVQCTAVRVPNEFTFRGTFGVTFVHFWDHCWSNFRLPGALLGRCGVIFSVKNGLGHQKCPRSRQSEISGISPHPFGALLELCFRTFSHFFGKNSGSEICPFFFDFWVALSAPQDGLICNPYTPAQSKHTFPFSHCFQKAASKRGHVGSVLGQFSSKIAILSEKIEAKTATPKKLKSKELRPTIGEIRGSLTGRLTCARFSTRKTEIGHF